MKKYLSIAAIAAMCIPALTGCSDDDETRPQPQPVIVTEGLFVINAGNSGYQIDGSITYIGNNGKITQDAFSAANGRSLGNTPNDAIIYGSKLYVTVTGENTIEAIDKNTLKSTQISTTEIMGTDKGKQPRRLAAANGRIFVSTFDGYVASIDTADYNNVKVYKVGSFPEGMTVSGQNLYVTNSDYGNGNASLSKIDLVSGAVTEFKNSLITNPTSITTVGSSMYILDYGQYDQDFNQIDAGVRELSGGNIRKVTDATMMAVDTRRGLIYTINAPYTTYATKTTYNVYDIKSGTTKTFIDGNDIESPAAIAVDPNNGDVYITSYTINPDTGYANYQANGYICKYTADGKLADKQEVGVGPTAMVFNYNTTHE